MARRFHRGKGKFKGKLAIIWFNCNEVEHIAARCPKSRNYKGNDNYKGRRNEDSKEYKDKGKNCYIAEEDDSDENDDEVVYVAMKDEWDEDEETTLVTCVNKNDKWIIDSGFSNHMIGDKGKFIALTHYDGNNVRFGNDAPCLIKGKGPLSS